MFMLEVNGKKKSQCSTEITLSDFGLKSWQKQQHVSHTVCVCVCVAFSLQFYYRNLIAQR